MDEEVGGVGIKQREKRQAGETTPVRRGGVARDSVARHGARCRICKHPEREEIEREFLDWVSPREIAETWKIASYRAIYRHAHAVGLFQWRRENRQAALDRIIERVGEVQVTAAAVVAAIRLSAKLDGEEKLRGGGNWGENPPATTADGAPEFGLRTAAGRLATERGDGVRTGQTFVLSLEGLPRTDAVTGHVGRDGRSVETIDSTEGEGRVSPTQTWKSGETERQGHGLKPVPPGDGRPGGSPLHAGAVDRGKSGRRVVAPTGGSGGLEATGAPPSPKLQRKSEDPALPRVAGDPTSPGLRLAGKDPRVVLAEDGRVAGIPWPKGKIAFAGRGRWRRGRGG